MARPKANALNAVQSIDEMLTSHIQSIKNQIEDLQAELKMAEQNKVNYDNNKDVIESIISLKSAPDSSVKTPTVKRTTKAKVDILKSKLR